MKTVLKAKKSKSETLLMTAIALLCVLTAALPFCMTAHAADYVSETWTFDVSYLGSAGEFYSLVAVKGDYMLSEMPELTVDNIIYIDQVTADEGGYAHFTSFSPKSETLGTLYLGGTDLEAPILLGRITDKTMELVYDANGVVIEYNGSGGTVKLPEGVKTISQNVFTDKGVTELVFPSTATELYPILAGVKYYYHPVSAIDFTGQSFGESLFLIGDHNNDGKITVLDLLLFLKNRADSSKYPVDELQADVNGDGKVSLADAPEFIDIIEG